MCWFFFVDLLWKILDLKQKWLAKMTNNAYKILCLGQYIWDLSALWLCAWLTARIYALWLVLWLQTGHYRHDWLGTSQHCLASIAFWSRHSHLQTYCNSPYLLVDFTHTLILSPIDTSQTLGSLYHSASWYLLLWKRNVESEKKVETRIRIH